MALHVASDAVIGVSYFSIPIALISLVRRRPGIAYGWVLWNFAAFILLCGTTHFFDIWTLWFPDYELQGLIKAVTATVSVITAISLWPLIPKILAIPSADELRQVNAELEREVAARTAAVEALQREIVQRERTEETLRQSQKMEGLGQLTGGVAHDFNNLLLILQGNLHLVKQRLGDRADNQVAAMERAIARGESLTRHLLTFARRQMLQPRVLVPQLEMPKMVDLLRRSLRGDIVVKLDMAPDVGNIEVDPNEFELALINIASNARDAMVAGGELVISIDTRRPTPEEQSYLPADVSADAEFVRFSLTDSGSGMARDTLEHIWEPFFTTKEPGKGTGLGLSQVHGFAHQSGGFVTAVSESGKGTTISICLPVTREPASGYFEDDTAIGLSRSRGRILLVEDNEAVAEVSMMLLEEFGYSVMHAHDAAEALHIVERNEPLDLVFSDIMMPGGISGLDLARALRARFPHLPVLLTSGYSMGVANAGADGFPIIPKPYQPDTLRRALDTVLGTSAMRA